MWTGIMINNSTFTYETKTRLTNNPVENWFSQLKNNLLSNRKVSISEFSSILYSKYLSKYNSLYKTEFQYHVKNIKEQEESWGEKYKNKNQNKGFYYENHDICVEKKTFC